MNRRLIFFILLASALPILKQFIVIKFLDPNEVSVYGWLLSISGIFVGFSHLGWGDSIGKKIAQDRSLHSFYSYHIDFKISVLSISLVSIIILPIFLLINGISTFLIVLLSIQVLLLSAFRNNTKILRALGLNNAFFYQMGIRNLFDLLLIFFLLIFLKLLNSKLIFVIEIISLIVLIFQLSKRQYFYGLLFGGRIKLSTILSTIYEDHKYPTTLFLTSLLSLLIEYFERFVFYYVLSEPDYAIFVFLSLHFSILLSTQALLFNLIFKKVAILQQRPPVEASKYIRTIFGSMLIIFSIGFYPALLILQELHKLFYAQYSYEPLALILVLLSGIVTVMNVFETYLLLSNTYKNILYLKILFLISYSVSIGVFYLINDSLSIIFVLMLSFGLRLLYLIACGLIFTLKINTYEKKTACI